MFPWVFEWSYDTGHYALLGAWYIILTIVGLALAYIFFKTASDVRNKDDQAHHGGGHH